MGHNRLIRHGGGVGIMGILGSLGMIGGGHNRHIRLIRHDREVGLIGIIGSLGIIRGIGLLACLLRLWGGCGRWGRNSVQFVHFFWCWEWGGRIFAEDKLRLGIDCK